MPACPPPACPTPSSFPSSSSASTSMSSSSQLPSEPHSSPSAPPPPPSSSSSSAAAAAAAAAQPSARAQAHLDGIKAILRTSITGVKKRSLLPPITNAHLYGGATAEAIASTIFESHRWILPTNPSWQRGRISQSFLKPNTSLAVCKLLLEMRVDPRLSTKGNPSETAQKEEFGGSLLHLVSWTAGKKIARGIRNESLQIAERLLLEGADPNAVTSRGYTPLHVAVQSLSVEMVELLLQSGGDPDLRNVFGASPTKLGLNYGVEARRVVQAIDSWRERNNGMIRKRIKSQLTTRIMFFADLSEVLKIADCIADYAEARHIEVEGEGGVSRLDQGDQSSDGGREAKNSRTHARHLSRRKKRKTGRDSTVARHNEQNKRSRGGKTRSFHAVGGNLNVEERDSHVRIGSGNNNGMNSVRWFNGRPLRKRKLVKRTTFGYDSEGNYCIDAGYLLMPRFV